MIQVSGDQQQIFPRSVQITQGHFNGDQLIVDSRLLRLRSSGDELGRVGTNPGGRAGGIRCFGFLVSIEAKSLASGIAAECRRGNESISTLGDCHTHAARSRSWPHIRGRPRVSRAFQNGDFEWMESIVKQLGLQPTVRPRGRPRVRNPPSIDGNDYRCSDGHY